MNAKPSKAFAATPCGVGTERESGRVFAPGGSYRTPDDETRTDMLLRETWQACLSETGCSVRMAQRVLRELGAGNHLRSHGHAQPKGDPGPAPSSDPTNER